MGRHAGSSFRTSSWPAVCGRLVLGAVAGAVLASVPVVAPAGASRAQTTKPPGLSYSAVGNADCTITFTFSNPTNAFWAARAHVGAGGPLASGFANGTPSGPPPYFGQPGVPFQSDLPPVVSTVTIPLLPTFTTQDGYDLVTSVDGGPEAAWRAAMGTIAVTVTGCLPAQVTTTTTTTTSTTSTLPSATTSSTAVDPSTTVPGSVGGRELARTGGSAPAAVVLAVVSLAVGTSLLASGRHRRAAALARRARRSG